MSLSTSTESQPTLPITDHVQLRKALSEGEPAALLMVYTRLSKDDTLLEQFAPYINSIFEPPVEIPEPLITGLRDRLFELLTRNPAPVDEIPSEALMSKMLSTAVGEDVAPSFVPMLKEQMGFETPKKLSDLPGRVPPAEDFEVLVIGAGLTGLLAAIKLHEAGYKFKVIEKNPEIGGTWYENTYPGAAVDTPSHFYSYSFELNPDWTHHTPQGPEFQRYLLAVTEKYDLRKHIVFNTHVNACRFDDKTSRWHVELEDNNGKRTETVSAVINAHGPLNRWQWPKIKGLQDFSGKLMHTAGWDHSVSLDDKRVVLIGTGASGVQVGSAIADQVKHLTVLQRSRHWLLPNYSVEMAEGDRWAQRHIPHYGQWVRFRAYWFAADGLFANIQIDPEWPHQDRSISAANDAVRDYCLSNYQTKLSDRPDLMEKLVPAYPVFGKRIVMDIDWLHTLKRDNVTIENTAIEEVSGNTLTLQDGTQIEADIIICATGFDTANMVGSLEVQGRHGRSLRDEWKDDPRGYLGVAIPGYPNYFITVGPNSAPNHAGGQNLTSETQIHYILECLELLQKGGVKAMEPTEEACQKFNDDVAEALRGLVWSHPKAPNSYYKNQRGRNFMSCPYRLVDYWNMMRAPKKGDFLWHLADGQTVTLDESQAIAEG
jgi:4-hydroxyacetophenone monooxygenase